MLPEIPTFSAPAPAPAAPRGYVRHRGLWEGVVYYHTAAWTEYATGPHTAHDGDGTLIVFPTFGRNDEQSRILRAAGYCWTGRGWAKRVAGDEIKAELNWARQCYAALHPSWRCHA